MQKRGLWRTRTGFYLAAIGSACGLGNLWRFPYIVGENGGGAFVLLYVLLALLLGLPLLIGELMLGSSTQQSILNATKSLDSDPKSIFRWVGRFSVGLSLVVVAYYAVISGWVLHYLTQFFVALMSGAYEFQGTLSNLQSNGVLQIGLASVHIMLAVIVVAKGVQEGLERWIGAMMPVFTILLALLMLRSLALPTAVEATRFLFYPDFSRLTWSSLSHACGHVLFTLSVGFGTMVTFGSYMRETDHIPTAGFRVTMVDTVLSLLAGLLIFPVALQASNIPLTDPGLLFEALPRFLGSLRGGTLFGAAFFLCLYLAALGATIGLLEVIVSNWMDRLRITRLKASWISGGFILVISILPALSGSLFRKVQWGEKGLLEILDAVLINWCLPLIALGMAYTLSRGLKESIKEKLFVDVTKIESTVMYGHWLFALKWVIPSIVTLALVMQAVGLILG